MSDQYVGRYWSKRDNDSVLCELCPRQCLLHEGQRGFCFVRQNIDGELIHEDDRVIIQKFVLQPGQWEGIHTHPEHQLVIVLKDTEQVVSLFGDKKQVYNSEDPASTPMSAFWRPGPVTLEDKHNSGNLGTRPLEWIAITFKKESINPE